MYLRAISIGYAVPRIDFDVVVHSVFRSAVNLKLAGEDKLLTLLTSGEAKLPQGILTNAPKKFSFEGLSIGTRGVCRGGVLNLANSLSVDLNSALGWECDLLSLNVDLTNPTAAMAWRCAWQALNDQQVFYGADIAAVEVLYPNIKKQTVINQRISKSLHGILDLTRECDLADVSAISALIGLGSGLTPSGDDLLTGYLAGLWCTAKGRSERLTFISALGEVVTRLSQGTNDISRTYLYHAARGQISSVLVNLVNAICTGSDLQHVCECTKSAMQAGHTSGMDAVTGLLFGLAVWDMLSIMDVENIR